MNTQIITSIEKKIGNNQGQSTSYASFPIGADIKYISSIINSSNNNLEEQIILDTDKDSFYIQDVYASDETETPTIDHPFIKELNINHYRINKGSELDEHYMTLHIRKRDHKIYFDSQQKKLTVKGTPQIYRDITELYYITKNGSDFVETWISAKENKYTYSENAYFLPIVNEEVIFYDNQNDLDAEIKAIDPLLIEDPDSSQYHTLPLWPPLDWMAEKEYSYGDVVQYTISSERKAYKYKKSTPSAKSSFDASDWDDLGTF